MFKSLLSNLKALFPQPLKKRLKRSVHHWLNVISTEYNFRFRRQAVKEQLNAIRNLPRNLHIEGTNICNAKCTFCAYPQMERAKETMPMEDFKRIINEYVKMGGNYVSLTPIVGDPFVDRNIFERLDYLYSLPEIKGFYFYTNAILMKPQVSQRLLAYGEKLEIHVSFGGFDRETYKEIMGIDMFDVVRHNIEAFIDQKVRSGSATGFQIALRCPLSKCTGDLWKKFRQLEREGVLKIQSIPAYDSWAGKVKEENLKKVGLEPTEKPYKRGACELLYMKPIVLANGKVNACACRDVEAELIVGDLKESTLSEVWTGDGIEELIERHESGDFPDVCKRCTWYVSVYNRHSANSRINQAALHWSEQ